MERSIFSVEERPKVVYSLDGLTLKEKTTFNGKTTQKEYLLQEVSRDELFELRISRIPGLVLKQDGKLYYTEILWETHPAFQTIGTHLCGSCAKVCKHCKKVDAWTVAFHQHLGRRFDTAVFYSGRIEKYTFIPYAIETFNCKVDVYLVLECANHVYRP